MAEIKEPIRIRRKKLTNGNVSLYLDIYLNGKREYEFLKLYLIPEKTKADREANRQTLQLANSIKARRIVEVQNGEHGFKSAYASDTLFFDYYRAMCARRLGAESTGNWGNWKSCLKHLQKYEPNERIRFSQITQEWVQGFRDYLEKDACAWSCDERDRIKDHPLSRNSRVSYFNKLRACLNQAYEDRIIPINPMRGVEGFKAEEGTRMYLTIEEVQRLAQTECEYPAIKRAFLFSCLTGLRRSDVIRLTWGASAGRVHSDYLQTEEDQRTGISRHPAAGRRTHGRARQGRRAYLPQHPLSELHQRNDQKVGIAGRNP